MKTHYEVVVIGAGFAGLSAGLKLKENIKDFVILEARNRAGGRTQTDWVLDDLQIDLGGQWFGPTQNHAYRLIKKYDLETFPTQLFGQSKYIFNKRVEHESSTSTKRLLKEVDDLASLVDLDSPENSPNIDWQDTMTFQTWLDQQTNDADTVKMVGRLLAGGLLGCDAGEVSLFQILFYIKSGNGVDILLGANGGAQQDRLIGGPQRLANCMSNDLKGFIEWDSSVTSVTTKEAGDYTLTLSDGQQITATNILFTIPPIVLNKTIKFSPELPKAKRQMFERILPGNVLKYHAIYEKPFWRDSGLSGQVNTSDGFIMEAVDNSLPGNAHGVITFFVYGSDVTRLDKLSEQEKHEQLIQNLVLLYGSKAANIQSLIVQDWATEPFTYGCFSGHFVPGTFMQYGDQRNHSVGNIHFAGTEMSNIWNGYIDGAIHSGEKEAIKILQKLSI